MTATLSDVAAFRTVFAPAGEPVVLVLVDPGQAEALARLIRAAEEIRNRRARLQLVLFATSDLPLPGSDLAILEAWARPLLPAVISTVDAVLCLGPAADRLLEECRPSGDLRVLHAVDELPALASPPLQSLGRFVLQNDWGIGDELLLSAVAREIVRAYPGTDLWIRSRFGFAFPDYVRRDAPPDDVRRIETIYQNPTLYGPEAHSPFPGHLVQQMLDKFALDTGLRVNALDVRPELDLGSELTRERSTVIVHSRPNSRLLSKDWGLDRWRELVAILRGKGIRVRQVGGREEPLLEGVEDLRGAPLSELSDVFARSGAVACVVGFLMHLAEATRTPAVVIYGGREHPAIDGYTDQVHLSSPPLPCRGRWGCHLGPDLECPHGMRCMEELTPKLVAGEVLSTLAAGGAR
jgi:hypothetical protein